MEVTDAHAQQALYSSLMEKPVIMVRFSEVEGVGRGGGGREASNKHMSYTWIIGIRKKYEPGAIVVLLLPLNPRKYLDVRFLLRKGNLLCNTTSTP